MFAVARIKNGQREYLGGTKKIFIWRNADIRCARLMPYNEAMKEARTLTMLHMGENVRYEVDRLEEAG